MGQVHHRQQGRSDEHLPHPYSGRPQEQEGRDERPRYVVAQGAVARVVAQVRGRGVHGGQGHRREEPQLLGEVQRHRQGRAGGDLPPPRDEQRDRLPLGERQRPDPARDRGGPSPPREEARGAEGGRGGQAQGRGGAQAQGGGGRHAPGLPDAEDPGRGGREEAGRGPAQVRGGEGKDRPLDVHQGAGEEEDAGVVPEQQGEAEEGGA
mmetsp:Transcript_5028/g.11466  ORF Transcript_5028/g.11466 Transcript_5028/m.11466 type:complete len:208 (+) Transcript_5028:195-818(+)